MTFGPNVNINRPRTFSCPICKRRVSLKKCTNGRENNGRYFLAVCKFSLSISLLLKPSSSASIQVTQLAGIGLTEALSQEHPPPQFSPVSLQLLHPRPNVHAELIDQYAASPQTKDAPPVSDASAALPRILPHKPRLSMMHIDPSMLAACFWEGGARNSRDLFSSFVFGSLSIGAQADFGTQVFHFPASL
ncbi:hypothetical protein B0H14DRAFT_3470861 [Mycena olivaceomarginata]|nr:hypothetical protein B0H14DRAFT_3470861 [Mycena olivaceomarginata]